MTNRHTLSLALGACLCAAAAQAAPWSAYTSQTLVPGPFLEIDACNTAAGDAAACGPFDEVGVGTSIDRSLAAAGGWHTLGAADLALATVSIAAGSPYPYNAALTSAGFKDLLSFDFPGLPPGADVEVGFRLVFDGDFADGSKVGMTFSAGNPLASANYRLNGWAEWQGSFLGNSATPVSSERFSLAAAPVFLPGASGGTAWTTSGQTVFEGRLKVRAEVPSLPVEMMAYGNGDLDLSSTGRLTLLLPAGASYSSASGVFLSAIPEPRSSLLLALGGLVLGRLALRQRRTAAPSAAG